MSSVSAPAVARRAERHCDSWPGLLYAGTTTDTRIATSPLQTGFVGDAPALSLAGRIPGVGETSPMSGATDFPEDCAGLSCSHPTAEGLTALVAGFVRDTPRRPANHKIAKPVSQRPDFVRRQRPHSGPSSLPQLRCKWSPPAAGAT